MESTLYSIGHGNKSIEEFKNELKSFDIQYLADIRTKPYSKWNPDFNRERLQMLMRNAGFAYIYMGDAIGGLPSDPSCYTGGHIDYEKLGKKAFFIKGLERLVVANEKSIRLAIMCSESNPSMCHRSKLVGQELLKRGVVLNHIVGIGKAKTQSEVMLEVTKGLGTVDLFGEETNFMSRKAYAEQNEDIYIGSL